VSHIHAYNQDISSQIRFLMYMSKNLMGLASLSPLPPPVGDAWGGATVVFVAWSNTGNPEKLSHTL